MMQFNKYATAEKVKIRMMFVLAHPDLIADKLKCNELRLSKR
jgi:hypothetical protein